MTIQFIRWSTADPETKARILKRSGADIDRVMDQVKPILADVKNRGDQALIDYARQFDGATLNTLKVTPAEFDEARARLSPDLKKAIDHAARNVRAFHAEQMTRIEREWWYEVEPGVFAGEKVTPIASVGLYVPGGKNQFPSAVYMLGIPAVLAGVDPIIMLTPPRPDGRVGEALLYAAEISGIRHIYKVGGAQAVAAAAYGTQTLPAVKKILGPGSPYVSAAKQLLSGIIDPGMPAGPSESITLCDETADPHNTILDLLTEAEHGSDSAGLLVTHDPKLAAYVRDNIQTYIQALPQPQSGWLAHNMQHYGGIILTSNIQESIDFSNAYAPEHLLLKVKDPESVLPHIRHTGEILIGEHTPFTLGNYATGVNHVLPTGGWAQTQSCTSVWDFLKRTSLSRCTREGFEKLTKTVGLLTDDEGFPAHGNALRQRKGH
jgi:histidinol dehydrogenase